MKILFRLILIYSLVFQPHILRADEDNTTSASSSEDSVSDNSADDSSSDGTSDDSSDESENTEKEDNGSESPSTEGYNTVCDHCLNPNDTPGNVVDLNGKPHILDWLGHHADGTPFWHATPYEGGTNNGNDSGRGKDYSGGNDGNSGNGNANSDDKPSDSTTNGNNGNDNRSNGPAGWDYKPFFGDNKSSNRPEEPTKFYSSYIARDWSKLDRRLEYSLNPDSYKILYPKMSQEAVNRERKRVFDGLNREASFAIDSIDNGFKNYTGTDNGLMCKTEDCVGELGGLNGTSPIPGSGHFMTPANDFMNDLLSHLPVGVGNEYLVDSTFNQSQYIDRAPYTSSHRMELDALRKRIDDTRPSGPHQWAAKKEAYKHLRGADNAYNAGDEKTGNSLLNKARFLVDIVTDFIPIIQVPKDLFRALVGKDPLTGRDLSVNERLLAAAFAALTTFTLGMATPVVAGLEDIAKTSGATAREVAEAERLVEGASRLGIKESKEAIKNSPLIERVTANHEVVAVHDASTLNNKAIAKGWEPPHLDGTKVVDVKLKNGESFVRVHGEKNQVSGWVMKEQDLVGKNSREIAEKFNLPKEPSLISRVDVPAGTNVQISLVGPNNFGKSSGVVQYNINADLPKAWYTQIGVLQ